MTGQIKKLEKTRGRILGPSEAVRIASKVRSIGATSSRHLPLRVPHRARALLTLTDRRLILVSESIRARKAEVLFEWPLRELKFTMTRRKLGPSLIHVALPGGGRLDFEQVDGQPARDWEGLHFRSKRRR